MEGQQSRGSQYHVLKDRIKTTILRIEQDLINLPQQSDVIQLPAEPSMRGPARKPSPPVHEQEIPDWSTKKKNLVEIHKRKPRKDAKEPSIEELLMAMQTERRERDPDHVEWTKEEVLEVLCQGKNDKEKTDGPLVVTSVLKKKKKKPLIGKDGEILKVLASYSDLRPEDVPEDVPKILGRGRPPLTPEKGQKQRELDEADVAYLKLLNSLPELPLPLPEKVIVKSPPLDHTQGSPENAKPPAKEKSPEKKKAPSPALKNKDEYEISATAKEMDGKPSECVQIIPGSLLVTRIADGIIIQISMRIYVEAGSRLMDIRIECPKYKPARINVDGKWMRIQ